MKYSKVISGQFLHRPNRFLAHVLVEGQEETVHVKNTGRCRELLKPGAKVWLAVSENPFRKTKYDLVTIAKAREGKKDLPVNMDSQAPNQVVAEWLPASGLFSEKARVYREVTYGSSRFDFYVEDGVRKAFMEVKGVTLERNGVASFPDAPTQRGVKHLLELMNCQEDGYEAYVIFVIQMKEISCLRPNDETHPEFGSALRAAAKSGVKILAMDCRVTEDSLRIGSPVRVEL